MSHLQTFLAAVILLILVSVGSIFVFRSPTPYGYDNNLSDSLNNRMKQNGLNWAHVTVKEGDIILTGTAPTPQSRMLAQALLRNGEGVNVDRNTLTSTKAPRVNIDFTESDTLSTTEPSNDITTEFTDNNTNQFDEQNVGQSDALSLSDNRFIIRYDSKSIACQSSNSQFAIDFRDSSPAISADSIDNLDNMANINRNCQIQVHIQNTNGVKYGSLTSRRIDEIRYYLMSTGFIAEDIILE